MLRRTISSSRASAAVRGNFVASASRREAPSARSASNRPRRQSWHSNNAVGAAFPPPLPPPFVRSSRGAIPIASTTASRAPSATSAAAPSRRSGGSAPLRARSSRRTADLATRRATARISATRGRTGLDAAFTISPPDSGVRTRPPDSDRVRPCDEPLRARDDLARMVLAQWLAAHDAAVSRGPVRQAGWRRLTVADVAPDNAIYVRLHPRAAGTAGSTWFDDVTYACVRGTRRC